jgi:phosphoenolpyruvate-protein kinase (PTS system EI component)
VIRTLDLGGDKVPSFLSQQGADTSAMGLRGLRYSIEESHMIQTQLRAVVRASRSGDVRCLFPMVTGDRDLRDALEIMRHVADEEGIDVLPSVGAMIETPAAVFEIERILDLVDFVSLGTNDLTQFILAADRAAVEMLGEYSILHPAVLKALRAVQQRAEQRGKEIAVCGEAAGDPETAALLVGLGFRNLSMSPLRAARVRRMIRALDCGVLTKAADSALGGRTSTDVQDILTEMTGEAASRTGLPHTSYEFMS